MSESKEWLAIYGDEDERKRRRMQMPRKLKKLGVLDLPRSARLLDLCCGHGEALEELHAMGFRDLHGLDLTVTEELVSDSRFAVNSGDACNTDFPAASFDGVLNIHAMHHFRSAAGVRSFIDEAYRILKPGGRLMIIDFPKSIQIQLAFWFFRQRKFLVTPYLKNFSDIIVEEWSFLEQYFKEWQSVWSYLEDGPFTVESLKKEFLYFYLVLVKPV